MAVPPGVYWFAASKISSVISPVIFTSLMSLISVTEDTTFSISSLVSRAPDRSPSLPPRSADRSLSPLRATLTAPPVSLGFFPPNGTTSGTPPSSVPRPRFLGSFPLPLIVDGFNKLSSVKITTPSPFGSDTLPSLFNTASIASLGSMTFKEPFLSLANIRSNCFAIPFFLKLSATENPESPSSIKLKPTAGTPPILRTVALSPNPTASTPIPAFFNCFLSNSNSPLSNSISGGSAFASSSLGSKSNVSCL